MKLNLIYVGEVNQRKGIYQICEAAKKLNNPNVEFNIIGTGYEAQKALLSPYEKYVTFHGPQYFEKLQNHLKHNHVFLFPSMGDGFGLVLLEAMACGVPCIGTNIGGIPEVITDGVDGYIVPLGDVTLAAQRVLDLFKDPQKHQAFREAAVQSVYHNFHSSKIVAQYEALYYEVVKRYE